jgi:hypothetical protein
MAVEVAPVEFEGPSGSGLEGVTDVALVMANAMSRLADEHPELREELEEMQQQRPAAAAVSPPAARSSRPPVEERGGRRRRRRRRRGGRRVVWFEGGQEGAKAGEGAADGLLDAAAKVLGEAGGRALHVRQIAESLAAKRILGGEVSEIERAVTATILLETRDRGRASRFVARGEARYQLMGARLPERLALAEDALRQAVRTVTEETASQLEQWLSGLGPRALEAVVRMYLMTEGYVLLSTLPPGRGVARLVVEDPEADEEDARVFVLVLPRRTAADPKLWEGEAERSRCSSFLVFATGGPFEPSPFGEARVVQAAELTRFLLDRDLGVTRVQMAVAMLDPTVIESIAGLDT